MEPWSVPRTRRQGRVPAPPRGARPAGAPRVRSAGGAVPRIRDPGIGAVAAGARGGAGGTHSAVAGDARGRVPTACARPLGAPPAARPHPAPLAGTATRAVRGPLVGDGRGWRAAFLRRRAGVIS